MTSSEAITIRKALAWEVARAQGLSVDWPVIALVGEAGGKIVGSGGLAWGAGRCWIWFNVVEGVKPSARAILRIADRLKKMAGALGEAEVCVTRDESYATSERLCRLCGFMPTGIMFREHEVYACPVSNS